MKTKGVSPIIMLIPLVAVLLLAVAGMVFSIWTYVLLAVVCPLAAYVIWIFYRDTEKKRREAEEKMKKENLIKK